MSGLSNNQLSIRRTDLMTQRNSVLGAKRVWIYHKAGLGDTVIDMSNLNFPATEYAAQGVTNPSYDQILKLNLAVNASNIEITGSKSGKIMRIHWKVVDGKTIEFINGYSALADEIYEIIFEPSIISGVAIADAQPLVQTYLLPYGATDVVTDPFEYNKFPTKQVGAVMVFRQMDPAGPVSLMMRNENNFSSGDGNYYELVGANGLCNSIRFNTPAGANGDIVTIVSVGSLVERPTTSMMSFIESMNGDVETLRTTVAALAGVPKTNFEGAPHSVDLATFGTIFNSMLDVEVDTGDREIATNRQIITNTTIPAGVTSYVGLDFSTQFGTNKGGLQYITGVGYNSTTGQWTTDPGVIINENGSYDVGASLHYDSARGDNITVVKVLRGGSTLSYMIFRTEYPTAVREERISGSVVVDLLEGDKVTIGVYVQTAGGTLESYGHFTIAKRYSPNMRKIRDILGL